MNTRKLIQWRIESRESINYLDFFIVILVEDEKQRVRF